MADEILAADKVVVDVTVTDKFDLHDNLDRWVAQGPLGPDQAERIEALETGLPAPAPLVTAPQEPGARLAYTMEALARFTLASLLALGTLAALLVTGVLARQAWLSRRARHTDGGRR